MDKEPITLISSGVLLKNESDRTSKKIETIVKEAGVRLIENTHVTELNEERLYTDGAIMIEYDEVLWLTGPKAFDIFKKALVPTDDKGFMLVNDFLQSPSFPSVFGAGDCVTISSHPTLPKNGVYAFRQAPVLYNNLVSFLREEEGTLFTPQKRYLSILSIGNKKGFLLYGGQCITGKWTWRLKHYIDSNYMKSFQ
ncbi:FAD-dependent oxidoreductase [Bacillus sp. LL01]|uniref:NAD(P)/FAD-dependent oxidoreductase n=1 Tax=Bacillus sp. LL01 TaxID=1665556 RepID=UPI00069F899A|nr:FAD-dependent oxidoreductase [Bacillus sp. LL01]